MVGRKDATSRPWRLAQADHTRSAAAIELMIVPSMSNSSAPKVRQKKLFSLMAGRYRKTANTQLSPSSRNAGKRSRTAAHVHHHQSGNDERGGHDAGRDRLLAENRHADQEGADRVDAGPDRIGGAQGNRPHGEREQGDASNHGGDRDDGRPRLREAVGLLHRVSPRDLQKAGDNAINPSHGEPINGPGRPGLGPLRRGRTLPRATEIG